MADHNADPAMVENLNINEGDVIVTAHGEEWEVTTILREDDIMNVRRIDDGRGGPNDRDAWSGVGVYNEFVFNGASMKDGRECDDVVRHY